MKIVAKVRRRGFQAAFAAAIVGSMVMAGTAGLADDVDDDRKPSSYTEMSLAELEAELATLSAESSALAQEAAQAESEQILAQAELSDSITAAMDAQDASNRAQAEVEVARLELGNVGAAMYRDGASAVPFGSYLNASSLSEINARQDAYNRLGQSADAKLQEFESKLNLAQVQREPGPPH